ncbi:TPA: right-handed parallel beta-helix repeat-containing protein [Candidatus Micrarchaeota archaeon]|nr:right-handed parallel beta-helix repeat-containing protein [Candidatus Micrarchaeota archaeon]
MTNTTFRPPSGSLDNITMLGINDSVAASEAYTINWTSNESALPADRVSFAWKFVNISNHTAGVSIDTLVWRWNQSEVAAGSYNEGNFELWKYNSSTGWTMLNDTPNLPYNHLSLFSLEPSSDYGILMYNVSGCQEIDTPGAYQLFNNAIGATIDASEVDFIDWTCIKITSSDVLFDCNGYNVTNDGTLEAAGIVINGSAIMNYTNVTVRNCPNVSSYEFGAYMFYSSNDTFDNITTVNNTDSGIILRYNNDSSVIDSFAYNNSQYGIVAQLSSFNNMTNNTVYLNDGSGFSLNLSQYMNLTDNVAYFNTKSGITMLGTNHSMLTNNTFYNNSVHGFHLSNVSHNNTINDSRVFNNTQSGLYIQNSSMVDMQLLSTIDNGQHGLYLLNATDIILNVSTVFLNTQYGVYLSDADTSNFTDNNITNNMVNGVRFDAEASTNNLTANYICFNGFDVLGNSSSSNIGALDNCDSFLNWSENGHKGCEYTCSEMWHRFYGNATGTINLTDASATNNVFSWPATGYNIYFTDYDSNINWSGLQAIGRNTTDENSSNDFLELDIAFETQSFFDNINKY